MVLFLMSDVYNMIVYVDIFSGVNKWGYMADILTLYIPHLTFLNSFKTKFLELSIFNIF